MTKRALTAAAVERLKPPASGQDDHYDAGYPGFGCRISHGGAKSWIYLYRLHGTKRRLTLGRYPEMSLAEARDAWRTARKAVDSGDDPAAKRPANEFSAVAEEWLKRDQAHNRSKAEVERVLAHDIVPALKGRLIGDIKRVDLHRIIDAVADRAPIMARRVHAYLSRLFKWAHGRGVIDVNPMLGLPKPGAENQRDRVLDDGELVRVWQAAETLSWPFAPVIQLLILTAARREEIGALRWSEVHGEEIILGLTKNGKPHTIPLSPAARDIVKNLPGIGSDFVFTTTGRTAISGWSRAKRMLDERAGEMPPWRLHDLRRTAATGMQRLGVSLQVVEAVLGHISGSRSGVVGIYQRYEYSDEKRRALNMWATRVEALACGKSPNVVALHENATGCIGSIREV